jgi:ribonuclease P/MRP protein subunit POP5
LVGYWQILGPLILGAASGAAVCMASLGAARRLRRVVAALLSGAARERDIVRARRILARRPRRRYIVFEVIPGGFREEEVWGAIKATAERLAGLLGLSLSGLTLIDYDEERSRGIVRVRREYKGLALAVLSMTRSISGTRALIVPLAATGSVKRARRLLRPP